jgi:hypothetical protein
VFFYGVSLEPGLKGGACGVRAGRRVDFLFV